MSDHYQELERRVFLAPLHAGYIPHRDTGLVGELFLREALRLAQPPDIPAHNRRPFHEAHEAAISKIALGAIVPISFTSGRQDRPHLAGGTMKDAIRFETAPTRQIWPASSAGWGMLIAMVLLIGVASGMILGMEDADAPGAIATTPAAKPASQAVANDPVDTDKIQASVNDDKVRRERELAAKQLSAKEAADEASYNYAMRTMDRFKSTLADPYSARFRDVWVTKISFAGISGGTAVCGVVNAKNAFGAYTGETPFVAVGDLSWTPGDQRFEEYFREFCLKAAKLLELKQL